MTEINLALGRRETPPKRKKKDRSIVVTLHSTANSRVPCLTTSAVVAHRANYGVLPNREDSDDPPKSRCLRDLLQEREGGSGGWGGIIRLPPLIAFI